MLQFELTHKHTLIQKHGPRVLGGGVYVHFRVGDVTNPGGMLCSPYQSFSLKANIFLCFELWAV